MCSSRTELHFIISFAADDFWLQSLIKVNNQKLARTRDVNVLEFASLNWTILRKLIHRALFFSLCAPLVAGIILCWSERLLSRYRRRGWRGGFIVFSPLRLLLRLCDRFLHEKKHIFYDFYEHDLWPHFVLFASRAPWAQPALTCVRSPSIWITMMKREIFFGSFSRLCVNDDDVTCLLNSLRWPFTMCL